MAFRNRPDNLRSEDTFEAVVGLITGRARLAPGGLKNLFIDDVAVEDGQGNAVFREFYAELFDGDPTILEPIKLRLGQSAGQTSVNLSIGNTYTNGDPGDWVTASMSQTGVDFVDIRLVVQQLYGQTKKGVGNQTATLEIEMRPSGATNWTNPLLGVTAPEYDADGISGGLEDNANMIAYIPEVRWDVPTGSPTWSEADPGYLKITGKTTSPHVKELRIKVPNTGAYANKSWQVRIRLIEQEYVVSGGNGENEDRRTIAWESIAGADSSEFGDTEAWRGLSHLQIYGKATDQISGIPDMTGIYDLGEYQVPPNSVWNPSTRVYTGAAWDGTTNQVAWTTCPAWQIKGLIEDGLSGVSALVPGSTLNKWDALEASKWFSELVPDGQAGTHPRYSAHWVIEQPMKVHDLVNYLAGAVGAFCWDEGDGNWRMRVEKPENIVTVFTKENIVGEFSYQHTDFDQQYNDITGVFRNKDLNYKEDRVRVWDQTSIDNTGRRHLSIPLIGCDNRQEALRRLKIRLLTAMNEIRTVTFTTNRQGMLLEPFNVIGVADGDLLSDTTLRSSGRITAIDGTRTQITLRDTLRLEVGVSYTISLTIPNPDYAPDTTTDPLGDDWRNPTTTITRTITNTAGQRGDVTVLYLDTALPDPIPEYSVVALSATGLPSLPKQYRVLNVTPDEKGELVTVTAHEIYTSKWTESDAVTESEFASQVITRIVPPPVAPSGGVFTLDSYISDYIPKANLVANWERPASFFLNGYRVEYRHNGGPWIDVGNIKDTFYEIPSPEVGLYEFKIFAIDRRGLESLPLEASYDLTVSQLVSPTLSLTRNPILVGADEDGNVITWTGAGGTFQLITGNGVVATGVVYSVLGDATGGLVATIDPDTGVYEATDLTDDQGTVTLRAVWGGMTFDVQLTVAKNRPGAAASNSALLFIYKRATSTPSLPTVGATYTFSTGALTGLDNGWSATVPGGTDPLYVATATANSTTDTDTIDVGDWASPEILSESNRAAIIYIYQRNTSTPTLPSATTTYTFSTGGLTGLNNGWSTTIPSGTTPLWVSTASAYGSKSTDTISSGEWTTARTLSTYGQNVATVSIFKRSASAPTLPSVSTTYTFETGVLTGLNNGWTTTVPAGTDPLYVATAVASSTNTTDTILSGDWASPAILAQDGVDGTNGDPGLNTASVFLYRRTTTSSAPSVTTTGTTVYTFATGGVSGNPSSWTEAIPDESSGPYLWIIRATAAATTATDNIPNTEWSTPVLLSHAGSNVANVFIYKRSATAPTLPSVSTTYTFSTGVLTGLNNGWTQTVPAGTDPLYVSVATAVSTNDTDSIASGEWASAVVMAQDGTDGADGLNVATVFLYARTTTESTPSVPSTGSTTYTFATGGATGLPSGWTTSVPASGGGYLWATQATAANINSTDTIANTEWSTPVLIAQDGTSPFSGYLTNESHSVPANNDGSVINYNGATGSFVIYEGGVDVSSNFTLSTQSNPQTLTVNYVNRTYTVTAGLDAGESVATLTIRATGSGAYAGVTIDKVFTLGKQPTGAAGTNGVNAKLLYVYALRSGIQYDETDTADPSVQTNTFTASKQNTTATVTWTVKDLNGNVRTPTTTYLSASTGDAVTQTVAQFEAAENGSGGVIIEASLTDGVTLTDKVSIHKVAKGAAAVGYAQDTAPGSGDYVNQLWIDTNDKLAYRWSGSVWVKINGDLSGLDTVSTSVIDANAITQTQRTSSAVIATISGSGSPNMYCPIKLNITTNGGPVHVGAEILTHMQSVASMTAGTSMGINFAITRAGTGTPITLLPSGSSTELSAYKTAAGDDVDVIATFEGRTYTHTGASASAYAGYETALFTAIDSPAAGTYTYALWLGASNTNGNITTRIRQVLELMEVKK